MINIFLTSSLKRGQILMLATMCYNIVLSSGDEKRQVYCCSETAEQVLAGISRIWVLADYRYLLAVKTQ